MRKVSGRCSLFAPGVFLLRLLLLLLIATTTTTLVQPVVGEVVSSSDDLSVTCGPQLSACHDDQTCIRCSTVAQARNDDYTTCSQVAAAYAMDSSTVYCFGLEAGVCCLDVISEHDCLANDPFVEYWLCALDAAGCWGDAITCGYGSVGEGKSGGGGDGASASLGEAFSPAVAS